MKVFAIDGVYSSIHTIDPSILAFYRSSPCFLGGLHFRSSTPHTRSMFRLPDGVYVRSFLLHMQGLWSDSHARQQVPFGEHRTA
ncbi:hypothetical protein M407DRAFT_243560 [Tulasnella calospora MUT 4182]|uniref:Uncharacterized protein n=1 Tax=Tulasnella calospora MUT 4182 TaxID=1051891 RepID=A0A0C3QIS7_9AGAM|nr:hypothetical protein M407DRAFT_243560 [Tulasnella calospora MUT 4182]